MYNFNEHPSAVNEGATEIGHALDARHSGWLEKDNESLLVSTDSGNQLRRSLMVESHSKIPTVIVNKTTGVYVQQ